MAAVFRNWCKRGAWPPRLSIDCPMYLGASPKGIDHEEAASCCSSGGPARPGHCRHRAGRTRVGIASQRAVHVHVGHRQRGEHDRRWYSPQGEERHQHQDDLYAGRGEPRLLLRLALPQRPGHRDRHLGTLTYFDATCGTWDLTAGHSYIESTGQVLNVTTVPAKNVGIDNVEWFTTRLYPEGAGDPVSVAAPCTPHTRRRRRRRLAGQGVSIDTMIQHRRPSPSASHSSNARRPGTRALRSAARVAILAIEPAGAVDHRQ